MEDKKKNYVLKKPFQRMLFYKLSGAQKIYIRIL